MTEMNSARLALVRTQVLGLTAATIENTTCAVSHGNAVHFRESLRIEELPCRNRGIGYAIIPTEMVVRLMVSFPVIEQGPSVQIHRVVYHLPPPQKHLDYHEASLILSSHQTIDRT